MNILILAPQPFFTQRGTPIAVKEVARTLAESGNFVDLLTFHEGDDIDIENCRLHRIVSVPGLGDSRPGFSLKKIICDVLLFLKSLRLLWCRRYDVIHAVEEAAFCAALLQIIFRVPFVYDMDSSLPRQLSDRFGIPRFMWGVLEWMEGKLVRRSLGVVAVCQTLEQIARRHDPEKVIVQLEDKSLLNGTKDGDEPLRERFDLAGPIIMYVGNLEPYQGIDLLLEAHQIALRDVHDVELVIVGGTADDVDKYRQRSDHLAIGTRTQFIGPRPLSQLGHYLRQADVLVSPRVDGNNTPMKIFSYLDAGRAILATRLETHTQVLDDEIAWLAEPSPAKMARGIIRLIEDPILRYGLGDRAKCRVRKHYSAEAYRRKLNDFYGQLQPRIKELAEW